jgi:hypothetical protein
MCSSPVAIGKMLPVIHDINTTMYSQYISNNASSASERLQSICKPDKHPHVDDHCIHSSAAMIRDVRVFSPPPPGWAALGVREKKKKKRTNKQTQKNIFISQKNAKCSVLQRTQGRQLPLLLQRYNLKPSSSWDSHFLFFLTHARTGSSVVCRNCTVYGMESMMSQGTTTTSFDPLIRLHGLFFAG